MNLSVRYRKGRKAQTLYVIVYCTVLFRTVRIIVCSVEDIRLSARSVIILFILL